MERHSRWLCAAGSWWRPLPGSPTFDCGATFGKPPYGESVAEAFSAEGLDGLWDIAPGRGRKPIYEIDKIAALVDATLQTKPAGMTHWSCRTMAQVRDRQVDGQQYLARSQVAATSHEDFQIVARSEVSGEDDRRGGSVPESSTKAMVLCVDEKSQIQALDRTQPGLPIKKGRCGTMTHDYKRNGTTTLFAALDTLKGRVVGECHSDSASGVSEIPAALDESFPAGSFTCGHGQLRHAQT